MQDPMGIEPAYPINLAIPRPESQSRLTNFPLLGLLIRVILLIPHFIVLMLLGFVAALIGFIAQFAILFTGKYPRGMFDFYVGAQRWGANLNAYMYHLRDEYPPFSMDAGKYALTYSVEYPASLSRFLNFPIIGTYIKIFLAIPHLIILYFLYLVLSITTLIAEFAILFSGSYPAGLHSLAVGTMRWNQRMSGYVAALTDKYPPFSMD